MVAPLAGAWIEIPDAVTRKEKYYRRSPCGSVDRNPPMETADADQQGRSPCGSVDRNIRVRAEKSNT